MGDARRRKLGEPVPAPGPAVLCHCLHPQVSPTCPAHGEKKPAPVVDIASARPVEPTVKPVVQARVLDFLNAMAMEGFHVERVTLDVRAYGRLLVELAANAKSVMPGEAPDAIHLRGPTGLPVVIDFAVVPR